MFKQMDDNHARESRSNNTNKMTVENIRTMAGRKAFGFRGPNLWNHLESETRTIESKNVFKGHISKTVYRDVNHTGQWCVRHPRNHHVCDIHTC